MKAQKNYRNGEWHLTNLNFLTEYIKAAGMTVPKFANAAGIMPTTLRYWLNVERNVDFPQSGFEKGATRRWRSKVSKSGYHSKFLSIF